MNYRAARSGVSKKAETVNAAGGVGSDLPPLSRKPGMSRFSLLFRIVIGPLHGHE